MEMILRDPRLAELDEAIERSRRDNDWVTAVRLAQESLDHARRTHGDRHAFTGSRWRTLGNALLDKGDIGGAREALQTALSIQRACLGDRHLGCAVTLRELARVHVIQGDLAGARPFLDEALRIREVGVGHDHPFTREIRGDLKNVDRLKDDQDFRQQVICKHNEGLDYLARENYTKAIQALEEALALNRRRFGDFHPDVVSCLLSLAGAHLDSGEVDRALPLLKEAKLVLTTLGWTNSELYARSRSLLARYYRKMDDFVRAEPLAREAVDRVRRLGPEAVSTLSPALNELGIVLRGLGKLAEAERIMAESFSLLTDNADGDARANVSRAKGLENLATLAQDRGDIARALHFGRQALDIKRATLGASSLTYANSLCNLGVLESKAGEQDAAEKRFREAIGIIEAACGPDNSLLLHPLDGLAGVYQDRQDLKQTELLYKRMEEILRAAGHGHDGDRARLLKRLASLYEHRRDADRAESHFREALAIWENLAAESDSQYVDCLACFGWFLLAQSRSAEAEPVFRKVQSVVVEDVGSGDEALFLFHSLIGLVLAVHSRNPLDAITFLDEAVRVEDRLIEGEFTDPEEHKRNYSQWRRSLTLPLYAFMALQEFPGDSSVACRLVELIHRRTNLSEEILLRRRALSVNGVETAVREKLQALDNLQSAIAQRVAEGPRSRWREEASGGPSLAEMREQERALGAELLTLIPVHQVVRQALASNLETLGQILPYDAALLQVVEERILSPEQAIEMLAGRIPSETKSVYLGVLIDQRDLETPVVFNLGDAAEINSHLSTFLKHISVHPFKRPLGTHRQISESAAGLWHSLVAPFADRLAACNHLFLIPDGNLWRLPWGALPADDGTYLTDRFEISYLSSVRDLPRCHAAPAPSIAPPVVIADPDFDLSAPEDWPWAGSELPGDVAGPNGMDRHLVPVKTASTAAELAQGSGQVELARLPGSRAEGYSVAALLSVEPWVDGAAVKGRVKALHSPYVLHFATHGLFLATEMEWEKLQTARRIYGRIIYADDLMVQMQFARSQLSKNLQKLIRMHGEGAELAGPETADSAVETEPHEPIKAAGVIDTRYALDKDIEDSREPLDPLVTRDDQTTGLDDLCFTGPDEATFDALQAEMADPMLRSGLVLAGFNTWMQNRPTPPEAGDGLLSAVEVAGMDLRDTELVVLSACQTGIGAVRNRDGVVGLRRAFVIAGARTLVLSQWSIPDDETSALITGFYSNLKAPGGRRGDALRQAQHELRRVRPDPYFWGAFICQGATGPLAWAAAAPVTPEAKG